MKWIDVLCATPFWFTFNLGRMSCRVTQQIFYGLMTSDISFHDIAIMCSGGSRCKLVEITSDRIRFRSAGNYSQPSFLSFQFISWLYTCITGTTGSMHMNEWIITMLIQVWSLLGPELKWKYLLTGSTCLTNSSDNNVVLGHAATANSGLTSQPYNTQYCKNLNVKFSAYWIVCIHSTNWVNYVKL